MCVVSRKPSVRLLLALAPHLAQPSALPLLPAPAWLGQHCPAPRGVAAQPELTLAVGRPGVQNKLMHHATSAVNMQTS